jgi:hypothetical protein
MEDEHRTHKTHNQQFCKRMHDFLSIMFTAQVCVSLSDANAFAESSVKQKGQDVTWRRGRHYDGWKQKSSGCDSTPGHGKVSWAVLWPHALLEGDGRRRIC